MWEEGQNGGGHTGREKEEGVRVRLPGILKVWVCFWQQGLVIQKQLSESAERRNKRLQQHSLLQPWGFKEGQVRHPSSQIKLRSQRKKRRGGERERERKERLPQTGFCSLSQRRGRGTHSGQWVTEDPHLQGGRAVFTLRSVSGEVHLGLIKTDNYIMWVSATGKRINIFTVTRRFTGLHWRGHLNVIIPTNPGNSIHTVVQRDTD